MRIDLTAILNGRADSLGFDYYFSTGETDSGVLLPDGIDITEPVRVCGTVTDKNNCMFLNARITVKYHTLCDRCLDDINGVLEFDYERMISADAASSPDGDAEEDILYVNESGVDIDSSLMEDIALELPTYRLCREDCRGLCQKCGKNLNDGDCGCENKKEIDPRLKILQKLLDNCD